MHIPSADLKSVEFSHAQLALAKRVSDNPRSHEGDPIIKHGTAMENSHCGIDDIPIKKSWLLVSTPLKNMSQLGSLFPIYGNIIQMFQTTNQHNFPAMSRDTGGYVLFGPVFRAQIPSVSGPFRHRSGPLPASFSTPTGRLGSFLPHNQ